MIANKTKMETLGVRDVMQNSESVIASEPTNLQTSMDLLTSLRAASLANLQALSDSCAELLTHAGSGPKSSESCASYDPASGCLKIHQASLDLKMDGPGMESSVDWSRSGMICGGTYFPRPRLVQDIGASESCSSAHLPTPRASANESRQTKVTPSCAAGEHGPALQASVIAKLLPTPSARDHKDTPNMARKGTNPDGTNRERDDMLPRRIYGELIPTPRAGKVTTELEASWLARNESGKAAPRPLALHCQTFGAESSAPTGGMRLTPEFLSWLMGYPPSWLKPLRDALGTASSRKS